MLTQNDLKQIGTIVGGTVNDAVNSAVNATVVTAVNNAVNTTVGTAVNSAVGTAINTTVNIIVKAAIDEAFDSKLPIIVRAIVREETESMRQLLGIHSLQLQALQTRVGSLEQEVRRTGVLLEDLDDRFVTLAEAVDKSLNNRNQVRDHEKRIIGIEQDQNSVRAILKARFNN